MDRSVPTDKGTYQYNGEKFVFDGTYWVNGATSYWFASSEMTDHFRAAIEKQNLQRIDYVRFSLPEGEYIVDGVTYHYDGWFWFDILAGTFFRDPDVGLHFRRAACRQDTQLSYFLRSGITKRTRPEDFTINQVPPGRYTFYGEGFTFDGNYFQPEHPDEYLELYPEELNDEVVEELKWLSLEKEARAEMAAQQARTDQRLEQLARDEEEKENQSRVFKRNLGIAIGVIAAIFLIQIGFSAAKQPKVPVEEWPAVFQNCDEARSYGAAPVHEGETGFGWHLDRDGDGVGCEPWAG